LYLSCFGSITNSGGLVGLYDNKGHLIHFVEYSDRWYGTDWKAGGGWSLEQIDAQNVCGGITNWKASENITGGTPGFENSVIASNPDLISPELVKVYPLSDSTLQLTFSESIDTTSLLNPMLFVIDKNIGTPYRIETKDIPFYKVVLYFAQHFESQQVYEIEVSEHISDWSGNRLYGNKSIKFAMPLPIENGDIIINELLFNPYPDCSDFIEIYNMSNKVIDLSELRLATRNSNNELSSICGVTDGFLMFPNTFSVLTKDAASISNFYHVECLKCLIEIDDIPTFADDAGNAVLTNKQGFIIDEFSYNQSMHFAMIKDKEGVSLERINYEDFTNDKNNWHSASEFAGYATPTYKNSQHRELPPTNNDKISIEPNIFSPDNDSYNDILFISYSLSEVGYVANVVVYDAKGRKINQLVSNELLGLEGFFSWDGMTDRNTLAAIGYYIIYVELFNTAGDVEKIKKTCVLSKKL